MSQSPEYADTALSARPSPAENAAVVEEVAVVAVAEVVVAVDMVAVADYGPCSRQEGHHVRIAGPR